LPPELRTGSLARRASSARIAISGGRQISIEEAPWQVAVVALAPVEEGGKQITVPILCGGAILGEREVLTAAECAFNPFSEVVERIAPEKLRVLAGSSEFKASEAEARGIHVSEVRTHPYYVPEALPPSPDDVAVLTLETPLNLGATEKAVGVVGVGSLLREGAGVALAGYGDQSLPGEPTGKLDWLAMTLAFPGSCGGEADALFLCASAPGGAPCLGDDGSGLTLPTTPATLAGVMEEIPVVEGTLCRAGALAAFANLAAPEIRDFIEGSEAPPHAPRGGGAAMGGVRMVGHSLSCEPGTWSYSPTFTFLFIDSATGQILQQGVSADYALSAADVGRTILCEVRARNAGGTGIVRVGPTSAIEAAPSTGRPSTGGPSLSSAPASSPPARELEPLVVAVPAEPARIRLSDARIVVADGKAVVRLHCQGHARCAGKLTLTVPERVKSKGRKRPRAVTIGSATFSIKGGATKSISVGLSSEGGHLLGVAHGHRGASLTLAQREPRPPSTQRDTIELVLKQTHSKGTSGKR
jgi:hypothetical protein